MRSMSVKKQMVKIQIDNGVTDRGTQTRQQWSKTYFSCNKRVLNATINCICFLCSIGHCAQEWWKKESFSEFLNS